MVPEHSNQKARVNVADGLTDTVRADAKVVAAYLGTA